MNIKNKLLDIIMKYKNILTISSLFFLNLSISNASDAITTDMTYFRTGPGTKYSIRGIVPSGNHVEINICKKSWCHVSYSGKLGWMPFKSLAFKENYALKHERPYNMRYYRKPWRQDFYPHFGYNPYNYSSFHYHQHHYRPHPPYPFHRYREFYNNTPYSETNPQKDPPFKAPELKTENDGT